MSRPTEKFVWYFAYGSNLNEKVFSGRRQIKPAEKKVAILDKWRLIFNLKALPFMEPCFANVEPVRNDCLMTPDHPCCVHGVAYKITEAQLDQVYRTEGDGRPGGYEIVPVKLRTYNGETLDAVTLHVDCEKAPTKRDLAPSKRYMNLIVTGAQQEGLNSDYIDWLKKHKYLDREVLKRDHASLYYLSFFFLALLAPIFVFIIVPTFAFAKVQSTTRKFRRIVLWPADIAFVYVGKLFWFAHDLVVRTIGNKAAQELLLASHQNI